MKRTIKILILIVTTFLLNPQIISAQCHIDDWAALKALYESTNGNNWINKTGWNEMIGNESTPPGNCNLGVLYGVSLNETNRVALIELGTNQLNGIIPTEIEKLDNLTELYLQRNQLNGTIPIEIGNLLSLKVMSLNNNQLSGIIPNQIGNLVNLTELYLHFNELSGSIPASLGNLNDLFVLHLNNNQLTGHIPIEIGDLTNLVWLYLNHNQLTSHIPSTFGNLNNLIYLAVNHNNLSVCYSPNLSSLCSQLISQGNSYISDGNNFIATWEDFCNTGEGNCINCGCNDPVACNYDPNATCDDSSCLQNCDETNVYPGDLNHDGMVNNQDVGLCGLNLYEIGPPRASAYQNTNWQAYPADDWNRQHLNNEDIKHFDCNGDGAITDDDHQAVEDNFGLMWSDTIPPPPPPPQSDYQTMLLPTEQIVDGYLFLNISLERRAGGDLTMQGGYFTIDYSEITGTINFATLGLNNESWLGTRDEDLFYEITELPIQKKIEIGFTKTDNLNSTGSGVIGELIISYNSSQSRMNGNPIDTQKIKISTIGVHNGNDFTLLEDEIRQVYMGDNSCQTNWTITENTPFQNQYKSNSNITTNGFVLIGTDQEVAFNASSRVRINEGFSVKAGADFKVRVSGCD